MALILYSTDGCHLCEEAEAMLTALQRVHGALAWETVDIAHDDTLFERYGWSIPVLSLSPGANDQDARLAEPASTVELAWPFDPPTLKEFLSLP